MIYRHNSTIGIKTKPCKSCGRDSVIFSKGRCQNCAKIETFHSRVEKESEEDLGDLIKDADKLVSRYIRLFYSDKDKRIECYTCDRVMDYYEAQCGHFISRSCLYLRWDSRNLRCQCEVCNCHKHGNIKKYRHRLNKEHPGLPDILYEESHLIHHTSKDELRSIISEYTQKLKLLNK